MHVEYFQNFPTMNCNVYRYFHLPCLINIIGGYIMQIIIITVDLLEMSNADIYNLWIAL